MAALDLILKQIQNTMSSERDKGQRFEEIIRLYLKNEPEWKQQFKDVVLWSKWEYRSGPDIGIDLVAETHNNEFVAVQCKFWQDRISKADIDSFLSASSKTYHNKRFVRRIIAATTELSSHAAEACQHQTPPVHVIGLADLENSQINWEEYRHTGKIKLKPAKQLRPHQTQAVNAVIEGFKETDRGKLIMACGTGKTFTALKLAEKYAGKGGTVLFLVPSLSLMSQTLREWLRETETELRCYAVCSDTKVGKHDEDDPTAPDDLVIPATTDGKTLAKSMSAGDLADKMTVVFSTYQSIEAIHQSKIEFDLIICDEAHRTTGAQLEGKDESNFVRVHDAKYIKGKKRLYMTATPRLYSADAKAKAKERDVPVWSMDEETHYGKEFYYLGFSQAVSQGLLSDYKVVILGVDERVAPVLEAAAVDGKKKKELPLIDPAKIIGCWNALAGKYGNDTQAAWKFRKRELLSPATQGVLSKPKAIALPATVEEGNNKRTKKPTLHRAVAFTTSIKQSQKFQTQFDGIVKEYRNRKGDTDKKALNCEVIHVDGTMNALERNKHLQWLKEDPQKNECRILTNARCLSEGVDVPALDAVIFLTPRKSKVDVVQSVGRVMRKSEGKDYGYIILPVVIKAGTKPEEALNDNEAYEMVWSVLQALRAHDDRFQNGINVCELDGKEPERIEVAFIGTANMESVPKVVPDDSVIPENRETQLQIPFTYDDIKLWKDALYATLVKKCGEKRYWEDWAKDVAQLAQQHIETLQKLADDEAHKYDFMSFLEHLRSNLNDSVTEMEAIEMLAQHIITKPVFTALFDSDDFSKNNPVSLALDKVVGMLEDAEEFTKENKKLEQFYESVHSRVAGVTTAEGRQKIIIELYDKFFKTAFPKMSERLGIVYTPIEVVDFILHSVNDILEKDFGGGFNAKGNDILDPFTGTGTFIVRLLQSGLIEPKNLRWEYENEIHANEIVLLAYYIAAVNIESTFHEIVQQNGHYTPFPGIVLSDTFTLMQDKKFIDNTNSKRAKRQKETPITVIIGNPPYSAGQKSANDNNQNQKYPELDKRVQFTYAEHSTAQNKNSLYDSYIRSFRWASDRIGERGVIGFVTNGGWLDGNAMDGFRKCLAEEFTDIYVFNLRGNQRTSGEISRKEGGKIFGSGSRAPIAITLLIKNPAKTKPGKIYYYDIGDYKTREEKLEILRQFESIENVPWQIITPNEKGDWINQRGSEFDQYTSINEIFELQSNGLKTGRDAWCYNFSRQKVANNLERFIRFYNEQFEAYWEREKWDENFTVDDFITYDLTKISWDRELKNALKRKKRITLRDSALRTGMYRPFCKLPVYFDRDVNQMVYQMPRIFPAPETENLAICLPGIGSTKEFCTLITNTLPDLGLLSSAQCFPYWIYDKDEDRTLLRESAGSRRENITDAALQMFQKYYGNDGMKKITKWNIFYYIYGLLLSPEYKERFANELKKQLPRIPFAKDFWAFSEAGKKLAELHLNYETLPLFPLQISSTKNTKITKMKFVSKTDKSKIIYNDEITISGIPDETYRYVVNGRSAIEWIMERYQVSTHKESQIINDPNDWLLESGNPMYLIELIQRVVYLSVESVKIIESLRGKFHTP